MGARIESPWQYDGPYVIELNQDAPRDHIPFTASLTHRSIRVISGTVQPIAGGVLFYVFEKPFVFEEKHIDKIRDDIGRVIWSNPLKI